MISRIIGLLFTGILALGVCVIAKVVINYMDNTNKLKRRKYQ